MEDRTSYTSGKIIVTITVGQGKNKMTCKYMPDMITIETDRPYPPNPKTPKKATITMTGMNLLLQKP